MIIINERLSEICLGTFQQHFIRSGPCDGKGFAHVYYYTVTENAPANENINTVTKNVIFGYRIPDITVTLV